MEGKFFFSTKALIIKDNKFLAMYMIRNGKKKWDMPGGRMEYGEMPEETLRREIKEEISLDIKPIKLIDTWKHESEDGFRVVGVIYHCEVLGGELTVSDEHDGYQWIDIGNFDQVFDQSIFTDRMKNWNWDAILESEVLFTNL